MTVGEKIQTYRKQLGLSQEDLGQKLLVSRQTISLWEKDQTVPTIDNLMRLSDIFGTSVDEILGSENREQNRENKPYEAYQFAFIKEELNEIYCLQRKIIYKRPILFTLLCILLILFSIGSSAPDLMIGFAFGMFLIGTISHVKGIRAYNKSWKNSIERISQATYEYKIFEDYISINIYHKNEKIRESKCYFTDIEQIQQFGKWLFFQFGGQSFIVRKSDLKENSAFYSYMYKNPSKIIESPIPNRWRTISIILFVASILSIFGALVLVGTVSDINGLFTENMWLFFLLTPIPIASIIFGFILKSKGYKYKKNIIVGLIMTFLLCVYGSFTFMF
ncbi:MAG: helix-turn-helix domain-containing protein [Clostridia bacterium]|nr:helix-turn-helix domain-containing protein [Clostridia bacterium]